MCNVYDIGPKIRPGHKTRSEKTIRERSAELPKTRTIRKTDPGLVVRLGNDGKRDPEIMRWGFHRRINPCINNTRADMIVAGRSMWSKAWSEKCRCLIPTEAYYEWSGPKGHKQAHRIRATDIDSDHWMWMAGVWEEHAEIGLCYSMITTTPNAAIEQIHNRMPVILPFGRMDEFLNAEDPVDLLVPYSGEMETPECESPLKFRPGK